MGSLPIDYGLDMHEPLFLHICWNWLSIQHIEELETTHVGDFDWWCLRLLLPNLTKHGIECFLLWAIPYLMAPITKKEIVLEFGLLLAILRAILLLGLILTIVVLRLISLRSSIFAMLGVIILLRFGRLALPKLHKRVRLSEGHRDVVHLAPL